MSRKFSVVVCTFNAGGDLKDCLKSLENQDYDEIEIIVVNDASTDGTAQYLEFFRKQSKALTRVVTNERNLGVAGSRNVGIQNATGEVIAFTDADCVADRHWITELAKVYDRRPAAAAGGRIFDARINNIWSLSNKGHDFVASDEGAVPFIKGCNMSFDAKLLRQFMFNDEIKYGYEEILLCDHLRDNGYGIYYEPRAIVHHKHRTDASAILRQKYLRGMSSIWYLRKRNKFFVYKRHFILFVALMLLPLTAAHTLFLGAAGLLFAVFLAGLLREELLFAQKTVAEIAVTLPFLIIIEFAHFAGSCTGVAQFHVLGRRFNV